jgi:uncharacterized protein (DUF1800 family)
VPLILGPAATAGSTSPAAIDHLLDRVTFGATSGDREHVREVGAGRFIDEQLDPASIDDAGLDRRLAALQTLRTPTPGLITRFDPPKPALPPMPTVFPVTLPVPVAPAAKPKAGGAGQVVSELQRAAFIRAVYTKRQLYERTVDFWENHFNVFVNKDKERLYLTSFDRDTMRPFAFGNFRQLLGAVAHSPAMLYYLDNWQSTIVHSRPAPLGGPVKGSGGLNENYARELLELHTLGVGGGYTQQDVQEVARCFTGWTIYKVNEDGLFLFNPAEHDNGEKTVLGHRIPPNGGIADGERVLDILARHPSTAHFIALKLARMLVSDDPPESLVQRAAAVYLKTDGSITETLRSILESREFRDPRSFHTKVKSPFEYAASAVRALGAETDGGAAMVGWIARMGQPVFGRLTPDGYPDRAETWLSTGTLLERINFALALANNQIAGTRLPVPVSPPSTTPEQIALRIGSPQFQRR